MDAEVAIGQCRLGPGTEPVPSVSPFDTGLADDVKLGLKSQ